MVAYLQDGALDDDRLTGKVPDHRVKGPPPDNQQKWYYKDPQGEIQGEFCLIALSPFFAFFMFFFFFNLCSSVHVLFQSSSFLYFIGPFSNREMGEWYQAGYFPVTLLLRRVCDETFQPLCDIIKLWGRVPFITPPTPRLVSDNSFNFLC